MYIKCFKCGKTISSELPPGAIFRGTAECPECTEKDMTMERIEDASKILTTIAAGVWISTHEEAGTVQRCAFGGRVNHKEAHACDCLVRRSNELLIKMED